MNMIRSYISTVLRSGQRLVLAGLPYVACRSETRADLFSRTALMERGQRSMSVERRDSYFFFAAETTPFRDAQ